MGFHDYSSEIGDDVSRERGSYIINQVNEFVTEEAFILLLLVREYYYQPRHRPESGSTFADEPFGQCADILFHSLSFSLQCCMPIGYLTIDVSVAELQA
jgi:hypothetical protein